MPKVSDSKHPKLLIRENALTWRGPVAGGLDDAPETRSRDISALLPPPRQKKKSKDSELPLSLGEGSTALRREETGRLAPLIRLKDTPAIIPRNIQILGQWEGVVSDVGNGEFTANLNSLSDPKTEPFTGELSFDEVSDSDRPLIERGSVFYWVIGYDKSPAGQVTRVSEVRFRRSPEWTSRKLASIRDEARNWFRQVQDEAK